MKSTFVTWAFILICIVLAFTSDYRGRKTDAPPLSVEAQELLVFYTAEEVFEPGSPPHEGGLQGDAYAQTAVLAILCLGLLYIFKWRRKNSRWDEGEKGAPDPLVGV